MEHVTPSSPGNTLTTELIASAVTHFALSIKPFSYKRDIQLDTKSVRVCLIHLSNFRETFQNQEGIKDEESDIRQ
jgi:hypothetical protein